MNTSGEAADQVVRMALQTGEVALKITGEGAKQLAVLLYAILKEQKKSKGRARLETLVRTGKPLTVFSVKESDIKEFVKEAKRYGVLYCAVRNPRGSKDGMVDLIVKEEDASRINRIVERFKFASVSEVAKIKSEIVRKKKGQRHQITSEPGSRNQRRELRRSRMQISWWMNCWERLCIKREKKRKTLFRQRQRNPVCPSLHPAGTAKPKRVLLSQQIQKMEGNLLYDRS